MGLPPTPVPARLTATRYRADGSGVRSGFAASEFTVKRRVSVSAVVCGLTQR